MNNQKHGFRRITVSIIIVRPFVFEYPSSELPNGLSQFWLQPYLSPTISIYH